MRSKNFFVWPTIHLVIVTFALILGLIIISMPNSILASAPSSPSTQREEREQKCFSASFEGGAQAIAVTKDGEYIGAGSFTELHIFIGGLAPIGYIRMGRPYSPYFAPHPTQHIMAFAWGKIPLIDLPQKKKIADLKPKGNAVFVAWRGDGTQILSVDDKSTVQIWDVATKKPVATWSLPLGKNADIAFADYSEPSRLLAVATRDGNIQVFEADSGRAVGAVMAHSVGDEPRMTGMSFHPDGRLLASCSYSQIIIWDTMDAKMKSRFSTRPGGLATCVKYFAKGTKLAVANYVDPGYGFTFFNAETGKLIAQGMVTSHESVKAWDMAFPDSEDPVIVIAAEEMLYECRYSAVIGKKPGIKIIR